MKSNTLLILLLFFISAWSFNFASNFALGKIQSVFQKVTLRMHANFVDIYILYDALNVRVNSEDRFFICISRGFKSKLIKTSHDKISLTVLSLKIPFGSRNFVIITMQLLSLGSTLWEPHTNQFHLGCKAAAMLLPLRSFSLLWIGFSILIEACILSFMSFILYYVFNDYC